MFKIDSHNITNITDIQAFFGMSSGAWYTLCTLTCIIVLLGLVGNSIVLYTSIHYGALKFDSVTLLFVHNMAIADLIAMLLVFIPMMTTVVAKRWVLGSGLCWFLGYFFIVPIIYEVLSMLAMTGFCSLLFHEFEFEFKYLI